MATSEGARELFSDAAPFDPEATCIGCRRPLRHSAPGAVRHPAFAGGIDLPDGRFHQLAIVCDECIAQATLERCIWESRRRSGNPSAVRYHFQQVGTPEARALLLEFVTGLRR